MRYKCTIEKEMKVMSVKEPNQELKECRTQISWIGKNLMRLRKEKQISKEALASIFEITVTQLEDLENGKSHMKIPIRNFLIASNRLGLSVESLLSQPSEQCSVEVYKTKRITLPCRERRRFSFYSGPKK